CGRPDRDVRLPGTDPDLRPVRPAAGLARGPDALGAAVHPAPLAGDDHRRDRGNAYRRRAAPPFRAQGSGSHAHGHGASMKRRRFVTPLRSAAVGSMLAAACLPPVSPMALAQSYPARPINVIVAFPPGGNTDIMARALQNEMSRALAQTVVIINKAGAAGTLGLIDLSRAAPDGYTIAVTPNNPLTAQPHVQKLPYAMDSFRYVCLTYFAPYVLIAGPQAPFKTFEEFVAFAKAKPENLVYGHAGLASQPHLGMLAVLKAIGAKGLGVPFGGAGPMAQALLSGTVMAI